MNPRGHSAPSRRPRRTGTPPARPAAWTAADTRPPRRGSRGESVSPTGPRPARRARGGAAATRAGGQPALPATVWPPHAAPIDPDAAWPVWLVRRIVTAFTAPGARVVLITASTPANSGPNPIAVGVEDTAPGSAGTRPAGALRPGEELAAAHAAVHDTGRQALTLVSLDGPDPVPHRDTHRGPANRRSTAIAEARTGADAGPPAVDPWADILVPSGADDTAGRAGSSASDTSRPARDHDVQDSAPADLVIASVDPRAPLDDRLDDRLALVCARLLRVGGILAVITHSHWTAGRLSDPTGAIVTAAQNADLLYLQHIVALHTPIRDGHLVWPPTRPRPVWTAADTGRTRARHVRAHSDLLVFAQPHDYHGDPDGERPRPPDPDHDGDPSTDVWSPAAAAFDGGIIR